MTTNHASLLHISCSVLALKDTTAVIQYQYSTISETFMQQTFVTICAPSHDKETALHFHAQEMKNSQ